MMDTTFCYPCLGTVMIKPGLLFMYRMAFKSGKKDLLSAIVIYLQ